MICSVKDSCRCQNFTFFHNLTSSCVNQKLSKKMCNKDNECRQDLGLVCKNNVCSCSSLNYSWSSTSLKCKLTYAKSTCTEDLDCNESENLVCRHSGECNCPTISSNLMCDCVRNQTTEQYWNGSKCSKARTFLSECSANYQCRTLSEKTICINKKCDCSDKTRYFWNGTKCVSKKKYNEICDYDKQCLDEELTICNNSYCNFFLKIKNKYKIKKFNDKIQNNTKIS